MTHLHLAGEAILGSVKVLTRLHEAQGQPEIPDSMLEQALRTAIKDARSEDLTKHNYDTLHAALSRIRLSTRSMDGIEQLLGYRDRDGNLQDEFKSLKFQRRAERLRNAK